MDLPKDDHGTCILCKKGLFHCENVFGKPLDYYICMLCWDGLSDAQRQKYIKEGLVPITRGLPIMERWRDYCATFGLVP